MFILTFKMLTGIHIAYTFLSFSKTQTSGMQWHIQATRLHTNIFVYPFCRLFFVCVYSFVVLSLIIEGMYFPDIALILDIFRHMPSVCTKSELIQIPNHKKGTKKSVTICKLREIYYGILLK